MKEITCIHKALIGATALGVIVGTCVLASSEARAQASTQATETVCYRFASIDTPNADEVSEDGAGASREDTWCYHRLSRPDGATFIFNADDSLARPELSAIVERDGTLTHASMLEGELTVHRLKSTYNPMPFPLAPPAGSSRVVDAEQRTLSASALETLDFLTSETVKSEDISTQMEGDFTASVKASVVPWRGYWWPYSSGRLHTGTNSPLAKYDRYVKARTGENPGARAWEASYHKANGLNWAGHCNGWAAAAILRKQPRTSVRDSISGVTFSVSDLKGLLSEKDKCIKLAFFGRRYNGKAGDDLKDIYPAEFHNTLLYYIGSLQKPVAIDYMQGKGVENHVISSYTMHKVRAGANAFTVTTTLKIHKYDSSRTNEPGPAPSYSRVYKYKIWVDSSGEITKGTWLTKNPDFLWVPLAPNSCGTSNPKVTEEWVQSILAR